MSRTEPEAEEAQELGESEEAIIVAVGGTRLAIGIGSVREVSPVPHITRLPFPPPSVVGVVSLRTSVLPVIDLGDRVFGRPASREGRLVIATTGDAEDVVALLVDGVVGLAPPNRRLSHPPEEVAGSLPSGWVSAVLAPTDETVVALLDLDRVLHREQTPIDRP